MLVNAVGKVRGNQRVIVGGKMAGTLVDLVRQDSRLQAELKELLKAKCLAPGIFHPEAYLVDTDKIERKWKLRSRSSGPYSDVGSRCRHLQSVLIRRLRRCRRRKRSNGNPGDVQLAQRVEDFVEEQFPDEDAEILASARNIGQYLEFMNRKSQGF